MGHFNEVQYLLFKLREGNSVKLDAYGLNRLDNVVKWGTCFEED